MAKNNPPVGSLPNEVADDVPAMISEGEFMIPADVVRYVGLDTIHRMMHEAQAGLKSMEDEGLIVDVDENGKPEKPQKSKDKKGSITEEVTVLKMKPMTEIRGGGMMKPYQQGTLALQMGGTAQQMPAMPQQMPSGQGMAPPSNMDSQMNSLMEQTPPSAPMPQGPGSSEEAVNPQEAMNPEEMKIPTLSAPLIQEFEGQPHLLSYINEKEVRLLQDAGGGKTPEGEPRLSPEGIPVFWGVGDGPGPSAPDGGAVGGNSDSNDQSDDTGSNPSDVGGIGGGGFGGGDDTGPGPGEDPFGGHDDSQPGDQDEFFDSDNPDITLAGETGAVGSQTFLGDTHVYRPGVGFVPKESPNNPNAISYAILSGANLANIKPKATANKGIMVKKKELGDNNILSLEEGGEANEDSENTKFGPLQDNRPDSRPTVWDPSMGKGGEWVTLPDNKFADYGLMSTRPTASQSDNKFADYSMSMSADPVGGTVDSKDQSDDTGPDNPTSVGGQAAEESIFDYVKSFFPGTAEQVGSQVSNSLVSAGISAAFGGGIPGFVGGLIASEIAGRMHGKGEAPSVVDLQGEGGEETSNWFNPGDPIDPEQEKQRYQEALRMTTGFTDTFGDGRFQDFVDNDTTGDLRKAADGLAKLYHGGDFAQSVQFVGVPKMMKENYGYADTPFAIKLVDKDKKVRFVAPNMNELLTRYAAENPDVGSQGGNYRTAGDFLRHYNQYGKDEGRTLYRGVFDFSNVGTKTDREMEKLNLDNTDARINPFLTDITGLFKDYDSGAMQDDYSD